ncbi:MAG: cytochrome P450 [Candidatus Binatia bacterium]
MEYNPFLPEVRENPYPYFAYLREHAPVYQVPGAGFWAVSRYDDVLSIVKNPHLFSSTIIVAGLVGDLQPWSPEAPAMIAIDPPDHTRLRKLVNRAFAPRRIAGLEMHLRDVVQQLLDSMAAQGECDLVRDLAVPLPSIAIAELLGVPPEQRYDFKRWATDMVNAMNGTALTNEDRAQIRQSHADFRAYFQNAIENCRTRPGDNLLSDLVRAEEENQTLTSEEILSLAILLIGAGNETTTNLLGSAVLALFHNPEELAKVRANPSLVPRLVEEALRYDSPVQVWPRQAMQEVEIAGTTLPAGSMIMVMFASANHDEHKFPDPERFDILRNTEGHVAFGFGIHFCLGAQLARLETRVALEGLLTRFPRLSRADAPATRIVNPFFRGLAALPLVVG